MLMTKSRKLKKNLAKLAGAIALDEKWRAESREKILASVRRTPFWREAPGSKPRPTWLDGFRYWVWEGRLLRPALAVFLVFAVFAGSSLWALTAAKASLPGDVLYPVKINVEKAQVNLLLSEEKKIALEMNFAGKRLDEINQILSQNQEDKESPEDKEVQIKAALEHFSKTLAATQKRIEKLESAAIAANDKVAASKIVNEKTSILEQNLLDIKDKIAAVGNDIGLPAGSVPSGSVKPDQTGGAAASLTNIDKALDKVDQANSKSLAVLVEGASQSQSDELKQVAVDKLQEKIKKIERNIETIAVRTDLIIAGAETEPAAAAGKSAAKPRGASETSTLPALLGDDKKTAPTAASSPFVFAKVIIEEVGEKPAEAKKTIEEAKKLLSGSTESLNEVLAKIQESKAIVHEVNETIKGAEAAGEIEELKSGQATTTPENIENNID